MNKNNLKCGFSIWIAAIFFVLNFMPLTTVNAHGSSFNFQSSSEILDKEEIDVVIKYIDLSDPNLKREGIPQIKKDEDNVELKYAVRSVLKNLPWARKIFIIMPNEKVRYFKDAELISDKIVYIKDKDLLGFDSASIHSFQFNFWRLKDFGVSKNFIYMDDDYFIGNPLSKSDFFYEEDGKIVPYVIYNRNVGYGAYEKISDYYRSLDEKINTSHSHSHIGFQYQKTASIIFLYKVFGRDIWAPVNKLGYFPHNALGENMDDLKETYDLVKDNYEYADECLFSLLRNNKAFVHQTVYSFYILNKHHRRINRIQGSYIDLANVSTADFNNDLFCINTGGNKDCSEADYSKARIMMNKLFPQATSYELPEIKDGLYVISSALQSNKVLDINRCSSDNGANLQLWSRNGTIAQKFKVTYQNDGSYVLEPVCSDKRIDVCASGATLGTNIWQYEANGTNAQKWYIIPAGKGYYNIVSACNYLCMDIDHADVKDGTNIHCWEPNGASNQNFKFEKAD